MIVLNGTKCLSRENIIYDSKGHTSKIETKDYDVQYTVNLDDKGLDRLIRNAFINKGCLCRRKFIEIKVEINPKVKQLGVIRPVYDVHKAELQRLCHEYFGQYFEDLKNQCVYVRVDSNSGLNYNDFRLWRTKGKSYDNLIHDIIVVLCNEGVIPEGTYVIHNVII